MPFVSSTEATGAALRHNLRALGSSCREIMSCGVPDGRIPPNDPAGWLGSEFTRCVLAFSPILTSSRHAPICPLLIFLSPPPAASKVRAATQKAALLNQAPEWIFLRPILKPPFTFWSFDSGGPTWVLHRSEAILENGWEAMCAQPVRILSPRASRGSRKQSTRQACSGHYKAWKETG